MKKVETANMEMIKVAEKHRFKDGDEASVSDPNVKNSLKVIKDAEKNLAQWGIPKVDPATIYQMGTFRFMQKEGTK